MPHTPHSPAASFLRHNTPSICPTSALMSLYITCLRCFSAKDTIHGQCQLVKNVENRINGLNIGIKGHSGMNPETNGVVKAICWVVLWFYCMANKQVWKIPAVWYNDPVSQKRYVKLTGTWNLCWRTQFLSGLLYQVVLRCNAAAGNGGRSWMQSKNQPDGYACVSTFQM